MIDSGVDPNPDTQAAVIGAGTLDPSAGTGDADSSIRVDGHPLDHGTEMAMLMAAPANGWGMVGIAPNAVRVYSLRAAPAGETSFPFADYSKGIAQCLHEKALLPTVTVISMSLGGTLSPSPADIQQLQDTVDRARQQGLDVLAAAGDEGGNAIDYPAAYAPVLAIGAADSSSGLMCSLSSRGTGLDLLAPGCDAQLGGIEEAFADNGAPAAGSGTSQATAIVSAVLSALRAYSPSLTLDAAETCLTATARDGALDTAAAFRACGLGAVVDAGIQAEPAVPPVSTAVSVPPVAPRLGGPRLALHFRAGRLSVRALDRPEGATLEVQLVLRRKRRTVVVASARSRGGLVRLRVVRRVALRARYRLADDSLSPWSYAALSRP
jgi:subtilisin family serine protease